MDVLIQERLTHEAEPREILLTVLDSKHYDMDYLSGISGLASKMSASIGKASFQTYASDLATVTRAAINARGTGKIQMFMRNYTKSTASAK